MEFNDLPARLIAELKQGTPGLVRLADNEDALGRLIEAYEAQEPQVVREILEELRLVRYCEVVCTWLCIWHCFRVCRVLKIEFPENPIEIPELQNYARGVGGLAKDDESSKLLVEAVAREDADTFNSILNQYELQSYAYLLCYWVCHLHCRRFCYLVCPPLTPVDFPDVFVEFRETAVQVGRLADDEAVFTNLLEAYYKQDVDTLQDIFVRLQLPCIIICRWLCITFCFRICYLFCPKIPRRFTVRDLQDFLRKWRELTDDPCALDDLVEAFDKQDPERFAAVVEQFGYQRLCYFLCHWICFKWCRLYCYIICPPRLECELLEPVGCVDEDVLQEPPALVVPVRGTAAGFGFDHYILEWSTDDATYHASDFLYPPIPPGTASQGNTPATNALLAYFDTTYRDEGDYFIRLTVYSTTGPIRQCKTQFSLLKKDVRIRGVNECFTLDKPSLDPTARFVENYTPKCSTATTEEEASFGGNISIEGGAFVGGCEDRLISQYSLYYKEGIETDCDSDGWTLIRRIEYGTDAQFRNINFRKGTSTLTSEWIEDCTVEFLSICLKSEPDALLAPKKWSSKTSNCELSGLYTLKLEVIDESENVCCDVQRVWLDNKPGHAHIQIGGVEPCADLFLSQFIPDVPDCTVPWPLPLEGIAYDEYIDESLPTTSRPNDNFDYYFIRVTRQGGPSVQIPIDAPDGSCFFGTNRVGVPANRCENPAIDDVYGLLAQFDLRAMDAICKNNTSYSSSIPAGFWLERGECCVYTFQLWVYDTTKRGGGSNLVKSALWPVKVCNDLQE